MKPTRSLPDATASAKASSSRPSRRHLSRATSASITARLATSPATAPPTPSATATSRGLAYTLSSLLARTGPVSVRTAASSVNAVTRGDANESFDVRADPLGEERLGDPRVAAIAPDELVARQGLDRLLRRGDGPQAVAAAVALRQRVAGLARERLQDELLVGRRAVP